MDPRFSRIIADAIAAGEDPYACGCMGCCDKSVDGACPCGKKCRCQCTLLHRVAQRREFDQQVAAIREGLQQPFDPYRPHRQP